MAAGKRRSALRTFQPFKTPGPTAAKSAAGQHEQHLQRLGRAHLDGEMHDQLRIAGVAAKGQVRHLQMLMNEELQRLGIAPRRVPAARPFLPAILRATSL